MQFPHSSYLIATKIFYHFVAINKCVKARYYYTVFGIYDNDVYITAQREQSVSYYRISYTIVWGKTTGLFCTKQYLQKQ